jgi:hypothetical protein
MDRRLNRTDNSGCDNHPAGASIGTPAPFRAVTGDTLAGSSTTLRTGAGDKRREDRAIVAEPAA